MQVRIDYATRSLESATVTYEIAADDDREAHTLAIAKLRADKRRRVVRIWKVESWPLERAHYD